MDFREDEIERYSRQILLPGVGGRGQERLRSARVVVVGAGGLGCPAAQYLVGAGVGRLALIDSDAVDLSNLHRQVLHGTADVGRPKAVSGGERLRAMNDGVEIESVVVRLDTENAPGIFRGADVVVEGADNFETKYLVNEVCVRLGIPWVHAGVLRSEGQILTVLPGRSACLRCLFPEEPDPDCVLSCSEAGILGPAAGVLGCLQAAEAVKVLLGIGDLLAGRLLVCDIEHMTFRTVRLQPRADCTTCGAAYGTSDDAASRRIPT